jgi:hypothetical protein
MGLDTAFTQLPQEHIRRHKARVLLEDATNAHLLIGSHYATTIYCRLTAGTDMRCAKNLLPSSST